jgi:hypothetical protein
MKIQSYHIGKCPICGDYGMLEIIYNFKKKNCSIMCDECLAEWKNPEDALKNANGFRKSYIEVEAKTATIEEIKEMGWEKYILPKLLQ